MAAWITVYLQRAPPPLSSAAIQDGIGSADWWTLGELLGLDEDEVDAFLDRLRWQDDPLELGVEGERPVQFHQLKDPERIREQLAELEHSQDLPVPPSVREHLRSTRAVVALEFGFSQTETLLESVALEIAYWLAEAYHGVIHGSDEHWYDHRAHRWEPITD